jgi:aminoglycoside 3'-phosphotransferase-1
MADASPAGEPPAEEPTHLGNPGGVTIEQLTAELPPDIAELSKDARWQPAGVNRDGTTQWRLERPGTAATVLLSVAPDAGGAAAALRAEAERITWLAGLLAASTPTWPVAVPDVLASTTDPESGEHYLAIARPDGQPADRPEVWSDPEGMARALATGLRSIHDLPLDDRFACSVDGALESAGDRVRRGLVDARAFDPLHAKYRPDELYEHALAIRPDGPEDPVVAHGNPTLRNTLVADGRVVAYLGLGHSGVQERYHDLAVMARELAHRVSPHVLGPFFSAYGLDLPDLRKLDFHLLLTELR